MNLVLDMEGMLIIVLVREMQSAKEFATMLEYTNVTNTFCNRLLIVFQLNEYLVIS